VPTNSRSPGMRNTYWLDIKVLPLRHDCELASLVALPLLTVKRTGALRFSWKRWPTIKYRESNLCTPRIPKAPGAQAPRRRQPRNLLSAWSRPRAAGVLGSRRPYSHHSLARRCYTSIAIRAPSGSRLLGRRRNHRIPSLCRTLIAPRSAEPARPRPMVFGGMAGGGSSWEIPTHYVLDGMSLRFFVQEVCEFLWRIIAAFNRKPLQLFPCICPCERSTPMSPLHF